MMGKLTASLRQAPATVPALAAVALLVVWATDQAGYPLTHWAPGGLVLLVLLAMTIALVGRPLARASLPVKVALLALAAYTAFSFLSILWAGVPGDAWEGADRTLLYLLVFALFACWPQRGVTAAGLLAVWVLSIGGMAVFTLVHLHDAGRSALATLLPGGRLVYPSGYPNANAAEWLMAFWPAALMAREKRLGWALRGLLAGIAVVLAEVALLSQSRGSLYSTPVVLVLVLLLLPRRTRTFALAVPIGAGIAAAAPDVLRVGNHQRGGEVVMSTLHTAITATLLAALAVGLVVALAAAVESRGPLPLARGRLVHRGTAAIGLAALAIALAGGLAVAGNPVHRLEKGWHSFKGGYGLGGSDRLISGLGSNRYDFYRVALDEFAAHPLVGIGVDNFQQQYLVHGRSQETPRYPHSVELRVLTQTGLIGALLALAGLGAALLACARSIRAPDGLAAGVAAAALAGFGYWVVHGSVDWFWEFAGLGAPAFAMLGLACSLAPGAPSSSRTDEGAPADAGAATDADPAARPAVAGSRRSIRLLAVSLATVLALVAAVSLTLPWLSELEVQQAARIWPGSPARAYGKLERAAGLNPLSDEPYLVAGSIALRFDDLQRAQREFQKALGRVPGDSYATLELGAIASELGQRERATGLLRKAVALAPRDQLARSALRIALAGRRVSVKSLDQAILDGAEQF
jgi:O-antigen ligase